jgi:glucokinase
LSRRLTGRPDLLPRINRTLILETLRRGEMSRTALAQATGLSLPAVSRLVAELLADRTVVEVGPGPKSGGRRPVHLRFNPEAGYAAGVDLGASHLAVGICDLDGRVMGFFSEARPKGQDAGSLLQQLRALLERVASGVDGLRVTDLHGVGVGVAGTVQPEAGVVRLAPGLPWKDGQVRLELERALGLPVVVDNDVNMALLGEAWRGAAVGHRNVLAVAVGTGIGAAVLADGRLVRGAHGGAGEVGYWTAAAQAAGGFGPFESYAAGPGIVRRFGGRARDAAHVFELARNGDAAALKVVEETAEALGLMIGNAATLLDPELVLLGGGVLTSADLLLPVITRTVNAIAPFPPRLAVTALGQHAVIVGGVHAVFAAEETSVPVAVR